MTINLDELRKTVENAGEAWADGEHIDIITPAVVLELIDEVESLRTRFKGMRASRDSERSRADKNANKLEQAEQAVVLANAECTRQKQQKGILFRRTTEAEQKVSRVQEACESDSYDMHKDYGNGELVVPVDSIMYALDGDTRRLADQGLGGGERG